MPLFSRTAELDAPFNKNEVVKATIDLPGVPSGTEGRIKIINGFDWRRYWVFFDNGVDLGQLDEHDLVRPAHWEEFFTRKADAEAAAAEAAQAAASGAAAAEAAPTDSGDGDPAAALRALIPEHLLERSRDAKARLTA